MKDGSRSKSAGPSHETGGTNLVYQYDHEFRPLLVACRTLESFARECDKAGLIEAAQAARMYQARVGANVTPCPWTTGWTR